MSLWKKYFHSRICINHINVQLLVGMDKLTIQLLYFFKLRLLVFKMNFSAFGPCILSFKNNLIN